METQNKLRITDVLYPLLPVLIMWGVECYEYFEGVNLAKFGLQPRTLSGLRGIFFAPFIHDDWEHLINNSIPMVLLGVAIFYFFRKAAFRIYALSTVVTGFWVWIFARSSFHIGASGLVYAFASFLFFSGFFAKNFRMIAVSLLIVFLYGSMIWGIFPYDYRISWESHLMGVLAGLVLAYFYREFGPEKKSYDWEDEEDEEEEIWFEDDVQFFDKSALQEGNQKDSEENNQIKVNYIYKSNDKRHQ